MHLFLDSDICISKCKFNTQVYDKRCDFYLPTVNFPFLDVEVRLIQKMYHHKEQVILKYIVGRFFQYL